MEDPSDDIAARLQAWLDQPATDLEECRRLLDELEAALRQVDEQGVAFARAVAQRPGAWADPEVAYLQDRLRAERTSLLLQFAEAAFAFRAAGGDLRWDVPDEVRLDVPAPPPRMEGPGPERAFPGERSYGTGGDPASLPPGSAAPHPAVPLDDSVRRRLQEALSGGVATAPRPTVFPVQQWLALAAEVGEIPEVLESEAATRDELRRLLRATRLERQETWRTLPAEVQVHLLAHLTARARCLQEPPTAELLFKLDPDRQLDALFSTLSGYLKAFTPGFVHGLARHHEPRGASWREDAQDHWRALSAMAAAHIEPARPNPERELARLEELLATGPTEGDLLASLQSTIEAGVTQTDQRLVRLLRGQLPLLSRHARFKTLRRAIKDAEAAGELDETAERATGPSEEWPCWHVVRGKRGALVGGDPREEARARIASAFELSDLAWQPIDRVQQIASLAGQIRAGNVDLVLLLQSFVSHTVAGKIVDACRDAGVPFVSVERGYGIERIRLAIEEDVGRRLGLMARQA